jgi:hypothetical protein
VLAIHNAIHSGKERVLGFPITVSPNNNCRQVKFKNVLFMEQNKSKDSSYAKLAREGHKITWGIRPGDWIKIMDGKITH